MTKTRMMVVAAALALSTANAADAHRAAQPPAGIAAPTATTTVKAHRRSAKHATLHRKHKRARKHKAA